MDDFNISSLHESKNEWGSRLITILTPLIIEGFKSIFDESFKLCKDNGEYDKYLMTFQNLIARIPKWNPTIIEQEKNRIVEKSGCTYLEELITCVHIIQLKILTAMRVGQKQKKIDINIPKIDDFIHKSYINCARKIYKNVYLFEIEIPSLQMQKQQRELEIIVQECILNTIRESIPIESILRAYMDETVEEEVVEEIKEQKIVDQTKTNTPISQHVSEVTTPAVVDNNSTSSATSGSSNNTSIPNVAITASGVATSISTVSESSKPDSMLKFSDMDSFIDTNNREEIKNAPKDIERLEEISNMRYEQRKLEMENDDDKLQISDQDINLSDFDIHSFDEPAPSASSIPDLIFNDIEEL
jgi:hypothetical protein